MALRGLRCCGFLRCAASPCTLTPARHGAQGSGFVHVALSPRQAGLFSRGLGVLVESVFSQVPCFWLPRAPSHLSILPCLWSLNRRNTTLQGPRDCPVHRKPRSQRRYDQLKAPAPTDGLGEGWLSHGTPLVSVSSLVLELDKSGVFKCFVSTGELFHSK